MLRCESGRTTGSVTMKVITVVFLLRLNSSVQRTPRPRVRTDEIILVEDTFL